MGRAARSIYAGRDRRGPPKCAGATAPYRINDPALRRSCFVYDAAVLISADRNERKTWAEHKARLVVGAIPLVPAPVVAQVSRSPQQAQLRRFLIGCKVVPLDARVAHAAGGLLAKTRTVDVVDAIVVTVALPKKAIILTGDPEDIQRLVNASGQDVVVAGV